MRRGGTRELRVVNQQDASRHVVTVAHVVFGGPTVCIIAGPCSVESSDQVLSVARSVAQAGAHVLRGGAFKPRTSPYTFQGLGHDGLLGLKTAREASGLPVVSEILDVRQLDAMCEVVDMFQVGSRNMYNYPLLTELGNLKKPVLLKRGFMATVDEWLGAAEYLLSRGNDQVVLCERGIRAFDDATRFVLDLAVIPVLRERTKLPIVVDPSHGTGVARFVESMACAAVAAGADGVMVEVHQDPESALSDGQQALTLSQFAHLTETLRGVAHAVGRTI